MGLSHLALWLSPKVQGPLQGSILGSTPRALGLLPVSSDLLLPREIAD